MAPVPIIDPADEVFLLYEDQAEQKGTTKWGWLRPLFRVLGWLAEPKQEEVQVSTSVAKRKRTKGAFEPEGEE